jgi:putative colanic acid biosysnthesis UDP-glucose lipid carrier transferase
MPIEVLGDIKPLRPRRVERSRIITNDRSLFAFAQRLLDPLLVALVLPAACLASSQPFARPYRLLAAVAVLTSISAFRMADLYRWDGRARPLAVCASVTFGWAGVVVVLMGLGHFTGSLQAFSRGVVLTWAAAVPVVISVAHLCASAGIHAFRARGGGKRTGVIVGAGITGREFAHRLLDSPASAIRLVGFFDDRGPVGDASGLPFLGPLARLVDYVRSHRVAHVFIALPAVGDARVARLMDSLLDTTASISLLPQVLTHGLQPLDIEEVAGVPLFTSCDTPLSDCGRRVLKRASDLALASLALLVAVPIMAIVALGVKLTSPGPVLFRQRRHGLDGREIVVYKFRTMTVMEDGTRVIQARRDDPRVTRFGRFLRCTSLDELPQLVNVLQGRMSVIGPRPHALVHNEQYRHLIPGYMRRHKIKPGLSGWAQVHGFRGETRTVDDMRARVEHDLYYLRNWSLRLDVTTAIKTLAILFRRRNAY